jgi:hypothetical protein
MSYKPIDWCTGWFDSFAVGFHRKLWISSCFVVFWSLWDHRNKLVFENKRMEWIELAYLIKVKVGFWMRGWCPEWQRPPRNEWKWNVDGSSRGKPGAAGIGGVLHNDWRNIG